MVKENAGHHYDVAFTTRSGRLMWFQNYSCYDAKVSNEPGSTHVKVAEEFLEIQHKLIAEKIWQYHSLYHAA
jgi:hypothetical protein